MFALFGSKCRPYAFTRRIAVLCAYFTPPVSALSEEPLSFRQSPYRLGGRLKAPHHRIRGWHTPLFFCSSGKLGGHTEFNCTYRSPPRSSTLFVRVSWRELSHIWDESKQDGCSAVYAEPGRVTHGQREQHSKQQPNFNFTASTPGMILNNYLRGWMLFDIASTVPGYLFGASDKVFR